MFDLTGKTALVTGAGQGVGAAIAAALAARGAVVAVNDLHAERAAATVAAISATGGRAAAAVFDVTDYAAVCDGIAAAESELGPLAILVNNAGVPAGMRVRKFLDSDPSEWRSSVDLNLYGVMNCCRATVGAMCERGWGRVITISSAAAIIGLNLGVAPYAAGKGGGLAFMRHLAMETATRGVTANSIAIGLINNQTDPAMTSALAKSIPTRRLGEPEDIAALCVYLASDEAGWMTGQTLNLNGGSPNS